MKYYLRISVLVIVGVCFLFLENCKPDKIEPPDVTDVTPIPQYILDVGYFKEGTWWVYKDSISDTYDTVLVTKCILDTIKYYSNNKVSGIYQELTVTTVSSHFNATYEYQIRGTEWKPGYLPILKRLRFRQGWAYNETILLYYPFALNQKKDVPYGDYMLISDTSIMLKIHNKNLEKCLKVYTNKDCPEDCQRTNMFLAKNIGIVKRELLDSNLSWCLWDYEIIQ